MSEHVGLEVYFKTSSPLPEQELKSIFRKHFEELAVVRRRDDRSDTYDITIHELALLEVISQIVDVMHHCRKNQRDIQVTVTYGAIWKH